MGGRRRYKWSPRIGELMSFVTMTLGAPALRERPCAWNAFVVVQGDKMLVVAVARHADCGRFCLSLPFTCRSGTNPFNPPSRTTSGSVPSPVVIKPRFSWHGSERTQVRSNSCQKHDQNKDCSPIEYRNTYINDKTHN